MALGATRADGHTWVAKKLSFESKSVMEANEYVKGDASSADDERGLRFTKRPPTFA